MTRVLHVQYTNPGVYPPLVRGAELLAAAGADVLMLGTRVAGLDALDASPRGNVEIRLLPSAADGWRLKAHYARYAAWVAREGAAWKPEWIYASDLLSTPIALALSALTSARVVYHEHDAPSLGRPSWMIRQCLAARRRLLHQADVVVTPNGERSASLSRLAGGRRVLTVWNCPLRPADALDARRFRPSSGLHVIYRGSINADRLPETVVDAIARAGEDVTLSIAGYETIGSRGHIARLDARARDLRLEHRVKFLGTIADPVLAPECARADIGLALMPVASLDENMRHMTGASNKVFEYWSSGIVPLVTNLPDWRATFVDPGYALVCDPRNADSVAAALRWAASHRPELRAMASHGWERLQVDWNYESQFAPVLGAMLGHETAITPSRVVAIPETSCAS